MRTTSTVVATLSACGGAAPLAAPPPTTAPTIEPAGDVRDVGAGLPISPREALLADARPVVAWLSRAQEPGRLAFLRTGGRVTPEPGEQGFAFRLPSRPDGKAPFEIYDARDAGISVKPGPRLAWAAGKMAATEYFSGTFYLGKLEGSLPVAEHTHEGSWEIICAVHANGTFTLEAASHRLTDGACVSIPPGHKHSWTPDGGTSLEAIQVYTPAGPEARFRALSAADAAKPGN